MGRRSRKRYRRPIVRRVRPLPKVFRCPACGHNTLHITMKEYVDDEGYTKKKAEIRCTNPECGLRAYMDDLPPIYEPVDVYAKFIDAYEEGTIEVEFQPMVTEESEEEGE